MYDKTSKIPIKGPLKKIIRDLYRVLGKHNRYDARGRKVVSYATQAQRQNVLEIFLRDLYGLGYQPVNVRSLREKHIAAVVGQWEKSKLSPATMTTRLSILRTFFGWIGKHGILQDRMKYLRDPASIKRSYVTRIDKSWSHKRIDINAKFAEVDKHDKVVGLQLRLQVAFGLRPKEAWLLRPHMADKGSYLVVAWGTKGRRDRANTPIDSEEKRALLRSARQYAASPNDSTIPKAYTLKSWRAHFYYICRLCGISREDGIVAHGLRHEYANNKYQALTGQPSPVRGGDPRQLDRALESAARMDIAEDLGHSREAIVGAYIGGR